MSQKILNLIFLMLSIFIIIKILPIDKINETLDNTTTITNKINNYYQKNNIDRTAINTLNEKINILKSSGLRTFDGVLKIKNNASIIM